MHMVLTSCRVIPLGLSLRRWHGAVRNKHWANHECCLAYILCARQNRHAALAGVLGDLVAISKDKSKVTVTTETAFSKR